MKTELSIGNNRLSIASRSRRRGLVAIVYLMLAVLIAAWSAGVFGKVHSFAIIGIVAIAFKFFDSRNSPGALLGAVGSGDERERQRWDHAHSVAYDWISWMLIAALFMAWFRSPNPVVPVLGSAGKTIAENFAAAMLMGGLILNFTLPQAIFLWTEPDMEAQQ